MTVNFEEYKRKKNTAKKAKIDRLDKEFNETMDEYESTVNQMYLKYHNRPGTQVPLDEVDNMLALLGSAGVQAKECREARK